MPSKILTVTVPNDPVQVLSVQVPGVQGPAGPTTSAFDDGGLTVGESTMNRHLVLGANGPTSGKLDLTLFTALKTESITAIRAFTNAVAAAPTPTLIRMAIYSVASDGNMIMVASIPNDTTLFSSTYATYTRTLNSPFTKQAGQRYALGILVVSPAATPQIAGSNFPAAASYVNSILGAQPMLAGESLAINLTDMPSTLAPNQVGNGRRRYYVELIP